MGKKKRQKNTRNVATPATATTSLSSSAPSNATNPPSSSSASLSTPSASSLATARIDDKSKHILKDANIRRRYKKCVVSDDETDSVRRCYPDSDSDDTVSSCASSESVYSDDMSSDEDDSHEWCVHCKTLIQTPTYESHAHLHSGRFDMWLCHRCFAVDIKDTKTCKCVMHCAVCAKDILYTDACIAFCNTSRGFCATCSDNIKKIAGGQLLTNGQ